MKRREVLKYTALITGAAVSTPLLTSILSGCTARERVSDYTPVFFGREEFEMVHDVVDCILPKTDSPSASEVGIDQTIDSIVGEVYEEKARLAYQTRFDALYDYLVSEKFKSLTSDQKLALLTRLMGSEDNPVARQAFLELRQQTISFYLTSEEIGEKFLNYLPVPGAYEPCIDLATVGNKIWSI